MTYNRSKRFLRPLTKSTHGHNALVQCADEGNSNDKKQLYQLNLVGSMFKRSSLVKIFFISFIWLVREVLCTRKKLTSKSSRRVRTAMAAAVGRNASLAMAAANKTIDINL